MQNDILQKQADYFKALAHPTRLKILELLRQGEYCVCEEICVCDLLKELRLEQSNVSQHLAVLRKQGIVSSRKQGMKVLYSIKNPKVYEVIDYVSKIIKQEIMKDVSLIEHMTSAAEKD